MRLKRLRMMWKISPVLRTSDNSFINQRLNYLVCTNIGGGGVKFGRVLVYLGYRNTPPCLFGSLLNGEGGIWVERKLLK